MSVQDNSGFRSWLRVAKVAIQLLVFNFLSLTLFSSVSIAAEESAYSILIIHGEWHERRWDREFDRLFSEAMVAAEGNKVRVSFQNLGIDKVVTPQSRAFYVEHIEDIIREQKVDMLVALLPTAVEFVLEIDSISDLPKVLVLPRADFDNSSLPSDLIRVVKSNSDEAIRKTIEGAWQLNPSASKVEFFSGAGQTDLAYMSVARALSAEFTGQLDFKFHSGMSLEELTVYSAGLSDDSLFILLPYSAYSVGDFANSFNFIPQLTAASSIPIYGIVDVWIQYGIAGGYFFTVDKYAAAASKAASSLIRGLEAKQDELSASGDYIFDYEQVSRWNLDVSDFDSPYILLNQPKSIFDDYSGFIYTIAILVFLLLAALCLQFVLLKRSDIAKLKLEASEKQARENEARLQLLTQNSLDVIWTWDGDKQKTTYCSPSIEALSGYTVDEFLSQPIQKIMTGTSAAEALGNVFSKESGAQVFEVELLKKKGEKVWCEIAAQPISESEDQGNFWVGVTRDISKRKETEKQQLVLQSQVRQAQKFESLGTLAGGIAHDFNNILGVIMGLTELLKLKLSDNNEALEIAEKLMTTSDRAKMMVGQILAFSRQSSGSKKAMNLNSLLLESFQMMQTGMPKSIVLKLIEAGASINVLADSNQLSQVFINTLTNAYEAVDKNEGVISVSISEVHLEGETKFLHGDLPAGRYARVQIADNGTGLADDEIEKIFDPFYTSKDLGNGMGLAIARGIVIGHSGAIDIKSLLGEGSTVSIYLPITELVEQPMPLDSLSTTIAKSTIVLVDDQQDLLETVSLMLRELGHECIACVDPKAAIDIIGNKDLEVDLVITDFSMPGISGLDIRQFCAKHRPDVPVILATGYSERIVQDELLSRNSYYVLNKPFGFRDLKDILNEALRDR